MDSTAATTLTRAKTSIRKPRSWLLANHVTGHMLGPALPDTVHGARSHYFGPPCLFPHLEDGLSERSPFYLDAA